MDEKETALTSAANQLRRLAGLNRNRVPTSLGPRKARVLPEISVIVQGLVIALDKPANALPGAHLRWYAISFLRKLRTDVVETLNALITIPVNGSSMTRTQQ